MFKIIKRMIKKLIKFLIDLPGIFIIILVFELRSMKASELTPCGLKAWIPTLPFITLHSLLSLHRMGEFSCLFQYQGAVPLLYRTVQEEHCNIKPVRTVPVPTVLYW